MHSRFAAAEQPTAEARPRSGRARMTGHTRPMAPAAPREDPEVVRLVAAARANDRAAWAQLEARFDPTLRGIARSYRLASADVDEVVQMTWLELFESIERIRQPAAIAGWLATVTRRNALRRRQLMTREHLTVDPWLGVDPASESPEEAALEAERHAALERAVAALSDNHRRLITVLLRHPQLSYERVGELLSMPVGSIGPSRARALAGLARDPGLCALARPAADATSRRPHEAGLRGAGAGCVTDLRAHRRDASMSS